ncbi:hypothetical protein BVRB_7g160210 [Beta vulgaris subsp. vulgaris]|nr:hypothetical protein BVRB_7g160210 [Beta vulgaris subsp. vulgaris]
MKIIHITVKSPFLLFIAVLLITHLSKSTAIIPQQLLRGFTATPNPTVTNFQPLLSDSTGNFSLSFLRVNQDQLALAIVHVASGEPLWQDNSAELAQWGEHTQLVFNGSFIITDHGSRVLWSTNTDGDRVVLTSAPDLQILKGEKSPSLLWQSFDFPSNTLVENQNFTSDMSLVSSNGVYTMRLGPDFIGLYAKFKHVGSDPSQIYYRHRAMQAKVNIVEGRGPISVRISSDGFLGMYQNGSTPADIQSFNSYQRSAPAPRRVRIEDDGNLKGYYWSGSSWVLDYQAISETCELPSLCGLYGLCRSGVGCSCLDNRTQTQVQTQSPQCYPNQDIGDLCSVKGNKFWELRRTGVELPYKELMSYVETASYEQCEKSCHMNCTCWGVLYNNASKFCYNVDYPIQTILEVGHESKMGYFKVWEGAKKKRDKRLWIGIGLLCGAMILVGLVVGFGGYKLWKRKKRVNNRILEEEHINAPGPYKDLGSSSFGSIELSNR